MTKLLSLLKSILIFGIVFYLFGIIFNKYVDYNYRNACIRMKSISARGCVDTIRLSYGTHGSTIYVLDSNGIKIEHNFRIEPEDRLKIEIGDYLIKYPNSFKHSLIKPNGDTLNFDCGDYNCEPND